jgi:hypothetical protein
MMAAPAIFLAGVLAVSAAHKALAPIRLAEAASRLTKLPAPIGQLLLVLTGGVEAVAALCLVFPATMAVGAMMAATLWSTYALALWRRHGEVLDCGCDLIARPRPVGLGQILRPAVLAGVAVLVSALPMAVRTPLPETLLAAVGFFTLYLGASEILAIPRPAWRNS